MVKRQILLMDLIEFRKSQTFGLENRVNFIDSKIREINLEDSFLWQRGDERFGNLYKGLEKYNLRNEALDIESMRLTSYLMSRLYIEDEQYGRKPKMNISEISNKHANAMATFLDNVSEW